MSHETKLDHDIHIAVDSYTAGYKAGRADERATSARLLLASRKILPYVRMAAEERDGAYSLEFYAKEFEEAIVESLAAIAEYEAGESEKGARR